MPSYEKSSLIFFSYQPIFIMLLILTKAATAMEIALLPQHEPRAEIFENVEDILQQAGFSPELSSMLALSIKSRAAHDLLLNAADHAPSALSSSMMNITGFLIAARSTFETSRLIARHTEQLMNTKSLTLNEGIYCCLRHTAIGILLGHYLYQNLEDLNVNDVSPLIFGAHQIFTGIELSAQFARANPLVTPKKITALCASLSIGCLSLFFNYGPALAAIILGNIVTE